MIRNRRRAQPWPVPAPPPPLAPATSDGSTYPDRLFALGCQLAQQGVQNAFIAIEAEDVTVTPFVGHQPQPSVIYHAAELAELVSRDQPAASPDTPPARQAKLLELVGHALEARACRTAFLVLYDGAAIIDVGDPDNQQRVILAPWVAAERVVQGRWPVAS